MYPLVALAATFSIEDVTRLLTAVLSACVPRMKTSLPLRLRLQRVAAACVILVAVITGVSRAVIEVHEFRTPL